MHLIRHRCSFPQLPPVRPPHEGQGRCSLAESMRLRHAGQERIQHIRIETGVLQLPDRLRITEQSVQRQSQNFTQLLQFSAFRQVVVMLPCTDCLGVTFRSSDRRSCVSPFSLRAPAIFLPVVILGPPRLPSIPTVGIQFCKYRQYIGFSADTKASRPCSEFFFTQVQLEYSSRF